MMPFASESMATRGSENGEGQQLPGISLAGASMVPVPDFAGRFGTVDCCMGSAGRGR